MIDLDTNMPRVEIIRQRMKSTLIVSPGSVPVYDAMYLLEVIDALVAEMERLKAGLEKYADQNNWTHDLVDMPFDGWVGDDYPNGYDLARSLLSGEEPPAPPAKSDKQF